MEDKIEVKASFKVSREVIEKLVREHLKSKGIVIDSVEYKNRNVGGNMYDEGWEEFDHMQVHYTTEL